MLDKQQSVNMTIASAANRDVKFIVAPTVSILKRLVTCESITKCNAIREMFIKVLFDIIKILIDLGLTKGIFLLERIILFLI